MDRKFKLSINYLIICLLYSFSLLNLLNPLELDLFNFLNSSNMSLICTYIVDEEHEPHHYVLHTNTVDAFPISHNTSNSFASKFLKWKLKET